MGRRIIRTSDLVQSARGLLLCEMYEDGKYFTVNRLMKPRGHIGLSVSFKIIFKSFKWGINGDPRLCLSPTPPREAPSIYTRTPESSMASVHQSLTRARRRDIGCPSLAMTTRADARKDER